MYAQALEKEKVYLGFQHVKMWGENLTLKINNKSKSRKGNDEKFKQAYEQPQLGSGKNTVTKSLRQNNVIRKDRNLNVHKCLNTRKPVVKQSLIEKSA